MTLTGNQDAVREPPKPSAASRVAGYILFGALFGVGGAFVIPWSHSFLLGVFWVLGGAVSVGALWATYQTRLTLHGISGFSMSGLELPRRVELSWDQIVRIEQSAYQLKLHGQDSTLQIGLVGYRNPQQVVDFVRSKAVGVAP
jgi:hypothetical protein